MVGVPGEDDVGLVLAVEEDELLAERQGVLQLAVILPQEVSRHLGSRERLREHLKKREMSKVTPRTDQANDRTLAALMASKWRM